MPVAKPLNLDGRDRRAGRVRRDFKGYPPVVENLARYISDYVVLSDESVLVLAVWTIAAHLIEEFDRFPHVAVTSPEKRCGKTTLLDVLYQIVPKPRPTTNISPAALYRVIELDRPTLLIDESQSITGRGAQSNPMIREILNAGIGKNAKVRIILCTRRRLMRQNQKPSLLPLTASAPLRVCEFAYIRYRR